MSSAVIRCHPLDDVTQRSVVAKAYSIRLKPLSDAQDTLGLHRRGISWIFDDVDFCI
jgi:hypothetical protein